MGIEVHTNIGGHGVVGVMDNGPGPCVLIRADMDALPLKEITGLPYASAGYGYRSGWAGGAGDACLRP
jgi:metal-dependent amidase/aminoacylase/carboxypeptidase family protein